MRSLRRKYIVNTRLQLTLMLGANVLAVISALLILTLMYYAQTHFENYATSLNLSPGHPALQYIAQQERRFDLVCLVVVVVQFLVFNATSLLVSHRVAGPLYRLERHLESVGAGGEPGDVRFRKGDMYQELAQACNKVMARLRNARATT